MKKFDLSFIFIAGLLTLLPKPGLSQLDFQTVSAETRHIQDAEMIPVTTHPDPDFGGEVSPDGKWLAFTSKRSGNLDIWIRPLDGGSATQITSHTADDFGVTWAPDGEEIAFTSLREDADGDIWRLELGFIENRVYVSDTPTKLTHHLGLDTQAGYSPNGKELVCLSNRDGIDNIWVITLKNKKVTQITHGGKVAHPDFSPDGQWICFTRFSMNNSHLFIKKAPAIDQIYDLYIPETPLTSGLVWDNEPSWSQNSNELLFSRISIDTNNDGVLTPSDPSAIWKIDMEEWLQSATASIESDFFSEFAEPIPLQLTPLGYQLIQPSWSLTNSIYFTNNTTANADILVIPAAGLISRRDTAQEQLAQAQNLLPFPGPGRSYPHLPQAPDSRPNWLKPEKLFLRMLAAQRILDFFPEFAETSAWAFYEIGRTLQALGFPALATEYFSRVLMEYPENRHCCALAEIERVESRRQELSLDTVSPTEYAVEMAVFERIRRKYAANKPGAVQIELREAELMTNAKHTMRAISQYQAILQNYVEFPAECAEAQYKVGRLYAELQQQGAARNAYLQTITRYPQELRWQLAATAQIFKPATEISDPTRRTSQFSELAFQYQHIPLINSLAQMQLAENMAANDNYPGAIQAIETIIRQHPEMKFINFESRIRLARYFLKQGNDLRGIETYQKIITDFAGSADSSFAETAQNELLEMYLESGERLWQLNEIRLSFSRFRRARSLVPSNITAQRGVIKCQYQMRQIDKAIHYYETAIARDPENPIFIYSLGLSHAYKATEKAEFEGKPFDKKMLLRSNTLVEQALALDYQMIPAYLTLSVNYELLERYDSFQLRQPKSWYHRILSSITTPIESIYRTVLRKPVARPEQYFEQAIQVLHKALTINDEKTDPFTEAQLALNLANNYYQLDEFGFDRAYQFYQYKMELDSSVQSPETETQIFARMGHCALVIEDFENGPDYFRRAIKGYHNLGKTALEVLNLKRLALLFQLQGNYEQSIHYFSKAAEIQEKRPDLPRAIRFADLEVLYRQLALNYNYLEDDEAVTDYTKRAFDYLKSGYIKTVKPEKNWLKIGILGWEFPVYNAGRLVTGQSTASTGFTTPEEKALLFSIRQDSKTRQQHFQQALHALQEKFKIYRELEDNQAQAIILNQIGALFYQTGNFTAAREQFRQSLSICKKEPFYEGGLLNIINICTLDFNRGRADSLLRNDGSLKTKTPALPDFSESLALIEQGLSYYQNEDFLLNPRYKIILLLLKGNFHLLRAGTLARSPENIPLYARPQNWLTLLDEVAMADTAFAHGEKIAILIEYPRENALIHLNQALAAELIGEKEQAYNHAQICRGIARRYGFDALHWRIDHFLGRFIWNSGGIGAENDPAFFFDEALEIVHRYPALKQNGTLPALSIAALRQLYLDAGAYFADTNQPKKALLVREQLFNHMLTEYLAGKQLQLNNSYAQNYWANARSYQQELLIQRQKLRALVISRTWVSPDKIKIAQAKLNTLQQEYQQLLADMANEMPRLTSLVQIDKPALEQVQDILPNDAVAVVFQLNNQQLFIWTVTADSLNLTTAHKKTVEIKANVQTLIQYVQHTASDDNLETAAMAVNKNLFAPIWSQLADKKHIIIIPDEQLFQLPFNLLLFYQNDQHFRQTVVQAPTLQEYFLNYQNRRIVGSRILFSPGYDSLAANVQALGYAQDTFSTKKSAEDIPQKMSMADILHFDVQLNEQTYDPALSFLTLNAHSKARFSTRGTEMFGRQSRNSLAILDGTPVFNFNPHTLIFMEFALLRAGAATQLWNFSPTIPEVNADFYQEFYQQLSFKPADEALLATWQHIHQKYGYPLSWAGFQLHGYGGMTQTESREFASKSFRRRVLMGNSAFRDQKWDEAIGYYEEARQMAITNADKISIGRLENLIIQAAYRGRFFKKAIQVENIRLAEASAQQDTAAISQSYYNLMVFSVENEDYSEAINYQQQFAELSRKMNQPDKLALSYQKLGLVYEKAQQYEPALTAYQQALGLFESLEKPTLIGESLLAIGRIQTLHQRNYPAALTAQNRALQLFITEGDDENQMTALRESGLSLEYLANFRKAAERNQDALAIARTVKDTLNTALCQYNLANISWKTGDYQSCLLNLDSALTHFKRLNSAKLKAVGFSTLGLVYLSLNQLDEALIAEKEAKINAETIESSSDISAICKNLALIYRQRKEFVAATQQLDEARKRDGLLHDKQGLAAGHRHSGLLALAQNLPQEALTEFHTGLVIAERIGDQRTRCSSQLGLARSFLLLENPDSAAFWVNETITDAENFLLPEISWRAWQLKGEIAEQADETQIALTAYNKTADIIEQLRGQLQVDDFKAGFLQDKIGIYGRLINLQLRKKMFIAGLHTAERAKSRNFLEMLANREHLISSGKTAPTLLHQDSLLQAINDTRQQLAVLRRKPGSLTVPEKEHLGQWTQQLDQQQKNYETYVQHVQQQTPRMADLMHVEPVSITEIQRDLPANTGLVEYYLSENHIYIWIVSDGATTAQVVEFPRDSLATLIGEYRDLISRKLPVDQQAKQLAKLLIQPIDNQLSNFKHLIIIPHGPLHYLPFAALPRQKAFLLDDFSLSYAPSATVLHRSLQKSYRFSEHSQILAFANPDLDDPAMNLEFSRQELASLKRYFPDQVRGFEARNATETNYRAAAPEADLILFSCHGEFDAKNPLFSALRLAASPSQDGRLETHEIFTIPLKASTVVLSACETGLGQITSGDDVIGLNRAFLFAGAGSVVSSLWRVDDLATAVMTKRFFRYLSEGLPRHEALRQAQLLVRRELNDHPVFWAGFNLTGQFD